jgi:hypothetical protein
MNEVNRVMLFMSQKRATELTKLLEERGIDFHHTENLLLAKQQLILDGYALAVFTDEGGTGFSFFLVDVLNKLTLAGKVMVPSILLSRLPLTDTLKSYEVKEVVHPEITALELADKIGENLNEKGALKGKEVF